MRETELEILKKNPSTTADKLGLPPGMDSNEFVVYLIRPAKGSIVFESKVAETAVNNVPSRSGGAMQIIVVDRTDFTHPVKIGRIIIEKQN